jgi:hypothetical protein
MVTGWLQRGLLFSLGRFYGSIVRRLVTQTESPLHFRRAEGLSAATSWQLTRDKNKSSCGCSINIDPKGSHSFWNWVTGHAARIVGAAAFVVGGVVAGAVAAVGGSLCLAGGEYTDLLAVLADPCAHIIVFGGTFAMGQFIGAGKLLSG